MTYLPEKRWVRITLILLILFACLQLFRPKLENPEVTSKLYAPAAVKAILQDACYDCHSNETRLSWFDRITPFNYAVAAHVRKGRAALNFSEWGKLSKYQQSALLFESLNQAEFGVMPLDQYVLFHPSARIDSIKDQAFRSYLQTLFTTAMPDTAKVSAWRRQYLKWMDAPAPQHVSPDPNGIAFMPDYKDWTPIACSQRVDKGTLRVIMGNDVTIHAIETDHTNPWPDGSKFVKVIWDQLVDSSGAVRTGEFIQTDFMIKDNGRYAATNGWGYARWLKGMQLTPYGKDEHFATECVNCHRSMKNNDYIFSIPINIKADKDLK